MPRETSPAFQFYPQDFMSDSKVIAMTPAERGVYILFLCHCWIDGSLPTDHAELRRLALYDGPRWSVSCRHVMRCFVVKDGRYIQPRLERERAKQAEYRELKRAAGLASAKQRANRHATELPTESNSSSSSSSSSSSVELDSNNKLVSTVIVSTTKTTPANGNGSGSSNRPIFKGQRFTVLEWMLENFMQMLGSNASQFALDEWFYALDAKAQTTNAMIDKKKTWDWLHGEFIAEVGRRKLPMAGAPPSDEQVAAEVLAAIQERDKRLGVAR